MKIGEVIKENRMLIGKTQEQLANTLQVSRSTISSWEIGRTYPDLEMIIRLSQLFNVSIDDLLKQDSAVVRNITRDVKKKKIYKRLLIVVSFILLLGVGWILKKEIQVVSINKNDIERVELTEKSFNMTLTDKKFYNSYVYLLSGTGNQWEMTVERVISIADNKSGEIQVDLSDYPEVPKKIKLVDKNNNEIMTVKQKGL